MQCSTFPSFQGYPLLASIVFVDLPMHLNETLLMGIYSVDYIKLSIYGLELPTWKRLQAILFATCFGRDFNDFLYSKKGLFLGREVRLHPFIGAFIGSNSFTKSFIRGIYGCNIYVSNHGQTN